MASTPPILEYLPGFEILTKHKEVIRQFFSYTIILILKLIACYKISYMTISRVLNYKALEHARPTRIKLLYFSNNLQVRQIIIYCNNSQEYRTLDYIYFYDKLYLEYNTETLERYLKETSYFCYIACQKPYFSFLQANNQMIQGLGYIFQRKEIEQRIVLQLDEIIFLVSRHTIKQKDIYNLYE